MERIEPLGDDRGLERPLDPRRRRSSRRKYGWLLVMIAAIVVAAVLVWYGNIRNEPPAGPAAPASEPAPPAATGPRHPIEAANATPAEASAPLPAVGESDGMLQEVMATLFSAAPLDRIFHLQQIVPRFVATIDNLPRQTLAQSKMSVQPIGGGIETSQVDGRTVLRTENAARYATYIGVMEQADPQKLVQAYVRFYPLFQKAYEDLGYPKGYFNDRLIEVIDHLLAAPEVPPPVALTQPKILYQYSDPSLEQLSAGQKIMIRIGPANESRVKTKLREIRNLLTGQTLTR